MVTTSTVPAGGSPRAAASVASPTTSWTTSLHPLASTRWRATSMSGRHRSSTTTLRNVCKLSLRCSRLAAVPPPKSTHTPFTGVGIASIMGTRPCRKRYRNAS
jgi:hypothetical protein